MADGTQSLITGNPKLRSKERQSRYVTYSVTPVMHDAVRQLPLHLVPRPKQVRRTQPVLVANHTPQGGSDAGGIAPVAQEATPQEGAEHQAEKVVCCRGDAGAVVDEAAGHAVENGGAQGPQETCRKGAGTRGFVSFSQNVRFSFLVIMQVNSNQKVAELSKLPCNCDILPSTPCAC